ncbi:AcrR family transcriptional regulator [Sphingobium xanthum]|jgi:TetR/AcrR family transcriptional regulator|uniref:TetR/AcrR family transcriptional regulator n=1 Tax=Sphingobium xanthum TaxID=1387165 RepID=UPI001C8B573D|nr:TetR/AcrR family transcriptional regulator [Sphingobium xanthum]
MAKVAKKRGQGRPSDNAVGRETVLNKTMELVQELPPARVTISLIAREAGVDPALIRYYFGDREKLLLAVVDKMLADVPPDVDHDAEPMELLEARIRNTARFTRSTKHVHRLMVDELADAKSADVRRQQGEMNMRAVNAFAGLLARDGGTTLRDVNPLFLHVALVGLFDFFVSARPVVRNLVPDGTDMDALGDDFEDFIVDLMLNGIRKR